MSKDWASLGTLGLRERGWADALDGSKGPRPASLYSAGVDDLPLTIGLIVMGYLVGSLPMGVIVARLTGGTDPRTVGSGRTGGTNALRAMGWGRAILVGLLDLAKGAVPMLIAGAAGAPIEIQALTGVAAVLGAWKSVFLRFHGGRGVATGVGGMLVVSPLVCLDRRARLLHHHRGHALRLARLAAGHRLRGRRRRSCSSWPDGWSRPGCSTCCPAWPSSGSPTATTSSACWPAPSDASTPRDRQPTPPPRLRRPEQRATRRQRATQDHRWSHRRGRP